MGAADVVLPPADDQVLRVDQITIRAALGPQAEAAAFDTGRAATSVEVDRMAGAIVAGRK